jgi:hypothetical protein
LHCRPTIHHPLHHCRKSYYCTQTWCVRIWYVKGRSRYVITIMCETVDRLYATVEVYWYWAIFSICIKNIFRDPSDGCMYRDWELRNNGRKWYCMDTSERRYLEMGVSGPIVWTWQLHDPSHRE